MVNTPTHIAGLIEFVSGAVATIITSFDVWHHGLPHLEIYGSEGSLRAPDPNWFGGVVQARRAADAEWRTIPLTHSDAVSRGIGVADLAMGLAHDRPHRAGGELAYHVLDVMQAFLEAAESGRHVDIESCCERPAALPRGLAPGTLDS